MLNESAERCAQQTMESTTNHQIPKEICTKDLTNKKAEVKQMICSIECCNKTIHTKNLCSMHYSRLRRHGDPLWERPKICSVDGCDSKYYSLGFCQKHYSRAKHGGGDPLATKHRVDNEGCEVRGCDGKYYGNGYCLFHYGRHKASGHPLIALMPTINRFKFSDSVEAEPCGAVGCTESAERRGYCESHYSTARNRRDKAGDLLGLGSVIPEIPVLPCREEGCETLAKQAGFCETHYIRGVQRNKSLPCSVPNCGSKSSCRGLCQKHYQRLKTFGDVEAQLKPRVDKPLPEMEPPSSKAPGTCLIANCDRKAKAYNMCLRHYGRWRAWDEVFPEIDTFRSRNVGSCSLEGCERLSRSKGLCDVHYRIQRKAANPEKVKYRRAISEAHRANRDSGKETEGFHTEKDWQELLIIFHGGCAYCGRSDVAMTRDHVIPVSRGGTDVISNILPACKSCNSSKSNIDLEVFLTRKGFQPDRTFWPDQFNETSLQRTPDVRK